MDFVQCEIVYTFADYKNMVMAIDKYKDIRPYNDNEVKEAVIRIAKNPNIAAISRYLYPDRDPALLQDMVASIESVEEFQSKIMYHAITKILENTAKTLSVSGLENISPDRRYLFISNHRDIVLDSSIIQVIFLNNNLDTTKLAIGDNLIKEEFMADVARSNKMLTVKRYTNSREMYASSVLLSDYIRNDISNGISSVWIAQRNGRTKDGNDITEQGLLKMLDMSGQRDFVSNFHDLAIVPVSISYEYEPCDILKAKELLLSQESKYKKRPGEDTISIITGILQFKGNIHFHFSPVIDFQKINSCSSSSKNEKFKNLSDFIDHDIISNYRLWQNNYIASDIVRNLNKYREFYSESDRSLFLRYIDEIIGSMNDKSLDSDRIRQILYCIYGNPVLNREKLNIL